MSTIISLFNRSTNLQIINVHIKFDCFCHFVLQWIDEALSRGDQVDFFNDEFRCPVYVNDVVNAILALSERWISAGKPPSTFSYGKQLSNICTVVLFSLFRFPHSRLYWAT